MRSNGTAPRSGGLRSSHLASKAGQSPQVKPLKAITVAQAIEHPVKDGQYTFSEIEAMLGIKPIEPYIDPKFMSETQKFKDRGEIRASVKKNSNSNPRAST